MKKERYGKFYRYCSLNGGRPDTKKSAISHYLQLIEDFHSAKTAADRAKVAFLVDNIWSHKLGLGGEEGDFQHSIPVVFAKTYFKVKNPNEKGCDTPWYDLRSSYNRVKESGVLPGELLVSQAEFEEIETLIIVRRAVSGHEDMLKFEKNVSTEPVWDEKNSVWNYFPRTLGLHDFIHILDKLKKARLLLDDLPEIDQVSDAKQDLDDHLRRIAREVAICQIDEFREEGCEFFAEHYERFVECVALSGCPIEHFQVSAEELRRWKRLPADPRIAHIQNVFSVLGTAIETVAKKKTSKRDSVLQKFRRFICR